jgi:multidrug efflux pump subunit AcrB
MFSLLHQHQKKEPTKWMSPWPNKRHSLRQRIAEFWLAFVLNYKRLLVVLWIAAILYWFIFEILLVELEILEAEKTKSAE